MFKRFKNKIQRVERALDYGILQHCVMAGFGVKIRTFHLASVAGHTDKS